MPHPHPVTAATAIAAACAAVVQTRLTTATSDWRALESLKTKPPEHSGTSTRDPNTARARNYKTNPLEDSGTSAIDGAPAQTEKSKSNPMEHSGTSLTSRQHAALRLLVRGHGIERVARYVGVERHTIARWKRNPAFAAELDRLTRSLQLVATRVRPNSFIAQTRRLKPPPDSGSFTVSAPHT
jgi:hypothetical protein